MPRNEPHETKADTILTKKCLQWFPKTEVKNWIRTQL